MLRLERGDDILAVINTFCAGNGIKNATLSGIGSIERFQLAHYSIETREFTKRGFDGIHEVTSLLGNVGLVEGQPSAHVHVNVSGPDMVVLGGHLMSGQCSATLELMVTAYPSKLAKTFDETIGLNVWDFS